jgi:hypothetical protein
LRILIVSALLVATASCAWPPPPDEVAVPSPPPLLFAPLAWFFAPMLPAPPPPPGRLTLSNFSFDNAHVEAVITGTADCAAREGTTTSDFVLPLNATRIIEAVSGSDVCWRRAIEPGTAPGAASSTAGWTQWNRAFLSSGRSVDSQL